MESVGCETIEMAALGRPFKLGMLYDCRADRLVPGLTLWDHEALVQDMKETPKPSTEFEIVASESIEIEINKDYEITYIDIEPHPVDISGTGNYITNCSICKETCHYPCVYEDDRDKASCSAMGPDGNCTKCKGKCHWTKHYNQKYKWEYKEVTKKKTVDELKKKYMKGTEGKKTTEDLIKTLQSNYQWFKSQVDEMASEAMRIINQLKAISLKPNPLSAPDYIDILIKQERNKREAGWQTRVDSLEEMKKKAELLATVGGGGEILGVH